MLLKTNKTKKMHEKLKTAKEWLPPYDKITQEKVKTLIERVEKLIESL